MVASGEGVAVADCRSDSRFAVRIAEGTGYVPHTMLVAPLVRDGAAVGALSVLDRRDGGRYGAARPGARAAVRRPRGRGAARRRLQALRGTDVRGIRRAAAQRLRGFPHGGIEAILDRVAPDLEVSDRESSPDRETLVGGEGMQELFRLNMEVFDSIELEPKEFVDAGDIVLVVLIQRVRGRASGVALESETVHAWEFGEGRAVRMQVYADKERALEALGLE